MGYNYPGAEYISDTAAHTGRFGKVVALEDSVIATLVAEDITGNALTAVVLKADVRMSRCPPGIVQRFAWVKSIAVITDF